MHGTSVSTVTRVHRPSGMGQHGHPTSGTPAFTQLYEAARASRSRTEERITETVNLHVQRRRRRRARLTTSRRRRRPSDLTHWSFEQLAGIAGAPPNYLRTLPAIDRGRRDQLRAAAVQHRDEHQLFADRDRTVDRSTRSPLRGTRESTTTSWPAACSISWTHTRPGICRSDTRTASIGAERVPSGAYLGDRDMFLFLVDGNRDLDDPTDASHAGLFRGFILRNSDVGAAALTLDVFLFRAVCANHIIWGFHHVAGFRRRHVGASIHEAWTALARCRPRARSTRPRGRSRHAPAGHLPGARPDARGGDRGGRCSDSSCRGSRPPRPTRWRNSTSRILGPSGATCRG